MACVSHSAGPTPSATSALARGAALREPRADGATIELPRSSPHTSVHDVFAPLAGKPGTKEGAGALEGAEKSEPCPSGSPGWSIDRYTALGALSGALLAAAAAKGSNLPRRPRVAMLAAAALTAAYRFAPRSDETTGIEVARYSSLRQFAASLLDAFIPRHRRLTQLHFGRIVSNPDATGAFSEDVGFNMTYNLVEPGQGNALHTHPAVEIFVALDGVWEISWGAAGASATTLAPLELIAVPAHVRHSYRNVARREAHHIMTLLPGALDRVGARGRGGGASAGAVCTDEGVLVAAAPPAAARAPADAAPADATFHLTMSADAMERCGAPRERRAARRACARRGAHEGRAARRARRGAPRGRAAPDDDLLVVVLEGSVDPARRPAVLGRTPLGVVARLDAVRIPAGAARPVVMTNTHAEPCSILLVESRTRGFVGKLASWTVDGAGVWPSAP